MPNRKVPHTSLLAKVIAVLVFSFVAKVFFSCDRSYPPIQFEYNKLSIVGLNNSDAYLDYSTPLDTFFSEAVALQLELYDTNRFYAASFYESALEGLAFKQARADEVDPSYIPRVKVTDISIKTLLEVDNHIKAGDTISQHFLCIAGYEWLYEELNQGIASLNQIQPSAASSIGLVLKKSIHNTQAQFEVTVTFENGKVLIGRTQVFTIVQSR